MTRQELAAAYLALVGYDPIADDPSMTTDDLRELLDGAVTLHLRDRVQTLTEQVGRFYSWRHTSHVGPRGPHNPQWLLSLKYIRSLIGQRIAEIRTLRSIIKSFEDCTL
jgi:hypothetical protein